MANEREIVIRIGADGSAAIAGIRDVGAEAERLGTRGASALETFRQNWAAISAGAVAVYLALQRVWSVMEEAAGVAERMEMLDKLTARYGTTAQGLVGDISTMSHGLIGTKDAAQVATDALAKGFSPAQVARLAEMGAVMAKVSGGNQTAAESFRTLEDTITAARERGVVRFMGATIDLETELGKKVNVLSKAQRAQELYGLVLERVAKIQRETSPEFDSAVDRMTRFTNSVNEAKRILGSLLLVVGQPFMAIFNAALTLAYGLAGGILTVVGTLAKLTDELGITHGKSEQYMKAADDWFERAARQAQQAKDNMRGAVQQLGLLVGAYGAPKGDIAKGFGLGEDTGDNQKRLEQLNELTRKYAEERALIYANELDRELVQLDYWFEEQKKKLADLGAADEHYTALVTAYTDKHQAARRAAAKKAAETEVQEQRRQNEEYRKVLVERLADEAAAVEARTRSRQEGALALARAWGLSEGELIKTRAAGELELLRVQQERLRAQYAETEDAAELVKLRREFEWTELEVAAVKEREAYELDARRVELEREIVALAFEQKNLVLQTAAARYRAAAAAMPGPATGAGEAVANIAEANTELDPAMQQYRRWEAAQDLLITRMEEADRIKEQRLRDQGVAEAAIVERTEAEKAAIRDAYGQYALMADAQREQSKYQTQAAYVALGMSLLNVAAAFSDGKSRAIFFAQRGLQAAMAIIQGHVAAGAALVPPPIGLGPVAGIPLAVAMKTLGYINAAAILATAVTGSGGGAGGSVPGVPAAVGAGSGGITSSVAASPVKEGAKLPPIINVHLYGPYVGDEDRFAREIIPALQKAWADGVGA